MRFLIYASGSERTLVPSTSTNVVKYCEERGCYLVHQFDVDIWDEVSGPLTGVTLNLLHAIPREVSDYVEWHIAKRIAQAFWDGYAANDKEDGR